MTGSMTAGPGPAPAPAPGGTLPWAARPPRASTLSVALTFAWRALLKIKHVPEQLADVIGIPITSTVLFTYLFGGALYGSAGAYLQFLLPGTTVLAVVFVSVYSGVTLNRDVATGAFDRFRSMPIWRPAPVVGGLIGDVGRYLLAALLVIGVGLLMGYHAGGGAAGVTAAVALVLLFAISLSWVWTAVGLLLRTPNAVLNLGLTIMFAVVFISNVFVDPKTMPAGLRTVTTINPVTHLVNAARGLMGGTPAGSQVLWVLAACACLTAIFAPLTMRLYGSERT